MEKIWRWLNLLLIIITLFSYLSPFVNPSSFWFLSILGTGYPWLLLFNLLFILFWALLKKWYFLLSVGCILTGWSHFQSFIGLNSPLPEEGKEVTVMSFNAMSYYKFNGKKIKAFNELLQDYKPDVICTQEAYSKTSPIDRNIYPYLYQPPSKKLIIYSKYPFISSGNIPMGNTSNGCTYVDVKAYNQRIRIYNLHLQSNGVTNDASKLRKEGDLQERETWMGLKTMIGKVKEAAIIRSEQAKIILEHIIDCSYPVIVCGDLNDTPLSYTYQLFSNRLQDGFKQRAAGIGTTYDGIIPVLRIDYIWADPLFSFKSYEIIKHNYSDHFPVMSRIQLNPPEKRPLTKVETINGFLSSIKTLVLHSLRLFS